MTTPQLIALPHLAILDVTGDDAQSFLHAQVPSDIRTLNAERAQISGWCTAKGRLLTTFVIWPIENGYRLVLATDVRDAIAKRLKMYVMRLKVQVTPATDVVYGLLSPATQLNDHPLPTAEWQVAHIDQLTAIRLDSTRDLLTGPESELQALAGTEATNNAVAWILSDIAQGFPLVVQATSEHYVPQMVNLDKLGGVSFKKGCYPGQEVVARSQFRGTLKRRAYIVSSQGPLQVGQEVFTADEPEQACGTVASAASSASTANDNAWWGIVSMQISAATQALHVGIERSTDQDRKSTRLNSSH